MDALFADLMGLPPTQTTPKKLASTSKPSRTSPMAFKGTRRFNEYELLQEGDERDTKNGKTASHLLKAPMVKSGSHKGTPNGEVEGSQPLVSLNSTSRTSSVQRQESQLSIVQDSEEERKKVGDLRSPLSVDSQENRPPPLAARHTKPRLAPSLVFQHRDPSAASSDSELEEILLPRNRTKRFSPNKRVIYSSDEEAPFSRVITGHGPFTRRDSIKDPAMVISDSDEEIIPDSQEGVLNAQDTDLSGDSGTLPTSTPYRPRDEIHDRKHGEEWSDDCGVIGYGSNKSPKKTYTPSNSNGSLSKFQIPTSGRSTGTTLSRPGLSIIQTIRSYTDDSEVIEISSDSEESDEEIQKGKLVKPASPIKKIKVVPQIMENSSNSTPASVSTPKSKSRSKITRLGTVTPTSPSGKAMSKIAQARYLETYARQLFEDLNDNVFNNLLDGCELVWSKLLSSTAGKAFLKKEKTLGGEVITNPDGTIKYGLKIELSTKVVDREERVRNTLSHEMCHLSTWIVDGVGSPDHGAAWKKWVTRVQRYNLEIQISTRHTYEIAYKYSWQCTNTSCGHIYGRFSKSINVSTQGCGLCRNPLKPLFDTPTTKKSAYNDFVKEQMKVIQSETPGLSGAAAMKLVAIRWKEEKAKAVSDGGVDGLVAGMGRLLV